MVPRPMDFGLATAARVSLEGFPSWRALLAWGLLALLFGLLFWYTRSG